MTATLHAQQFSRSSNAGTLLQAASQRFQAGDLPGAEAACRGVLELSPNHPGALQILALVAHQKGNSELALRLLDFVLRITPAYDPYFNRALILKSLSRREDALRSLDQALELKPDSVDAWVMHGMLLQELQQYQASLDSYARILSVRPDYAMAWNHRGSSLRALRRYDEALDSFDRAVALQAGYAEAHYNRGNLLLDLKEYEAAIASYDRALNIQPDLFGAWNNRGTAFQCMQNHAHAAVSFERAWRLQPDFPYLLGTCIHMKRQVCDWTSAASDLLAVEEGLREGKKVINPFALMVISDSPALQKRAAEIYIADICAGTTATPIRRQTRHEKVRIGYFSSDFRNHAVSYHMAEVFEQHDRSRLEIYAFSSGPDTQDAMRLRVAKAMDHFLDVREFSDAEVVRLSRELEIDIAVNLTGLTYGDRIRIFAERAAPIQVNYLGFPATMGAPFMDYILADEVLIPESSQIHYSEKIAYLPGCFQANDSSAISPHPRRTRAAEGLPEDSFVFCCFNNCGKITPQVFSHWMRILDRVPDSVLWLLASTPEAQHRLRKEAAQQGVAPERLVFAQSVPLADHLVRQQLADLFLDTHPFNAGATASPALRAGLPILTRIGESFAGRMGASLLSALGLDDLITTTTEEYIARAIEIGSDPSCAQELKRRVLHNRQTSCLFAPAHFTRNLEAAYLQMYETYQAGGLPQHIRIDHPRPQHTGHTTQNSSTD